MPFILFGLIILWTDSHTTYIKDWVKWNYTGYEQKKTWPTFNEINKYLKNAGSGRVVWEHTPAGRVIRIDPHVGNPAVLCQKTDP